MYVHASLGDTSLPASVRGSRGRPQPRSRSRKYRSRMVSVLPVSSPNYSETPSNSSETTYVDLTECARITPSFYYRRARVLTFRFLQPENSSAGARISVGGNSIVSSISLARCSGQVSSSDTLRVVATIFRGIKEAWLWLFI